MHAKVLDLITRIYDECTTDRSGNVTEFIKPLAEADPEPFGICLATYDGQLYEIGDTRKPFTMQSISKPLTYALALKDRGPKSVHSYVDVEPSGEAYNEVNLDPVTSRPRNPMINAGAIAVCSLVAGDADEQRFDHIRQFYSDAAGRTLDPDDEVYQAEKQAGDRNTAIAYLLNSFDMLEAPPQSALDLYVRQCAIQVDCRDLALMGATMANGGRHPLTGKNVMSREITQHVMSVMTTSGMYTAAGDWVSSVGLPAKSGVAGGIMAVLPGQLGLATFSPRLDNHGNSVRGFKAFRRLSEELELHFLHVTRGARSVIRATYTLADAAYQLARTKDERQRLEAEGDRGLVCELHGDILFPGVERVVRRLDERKDEFDLVAIDIGDVDEMSDVSRELLTALAEHLNAEGKRAVLIDPDARLPDTDPDSDSAITVFGDLDEALSWCGDALLGRESADSG